jgi:hypothetical protein
MDWKREKRRTGAQKSRKTGRKVRRRTVRAGSDWDVLAYPILLSTEGIKYISPIYIYMVDGNRPPTAVVEEGDSGAFFRRDTSRASRPTDVE